MSPAPQNHHVIGYLCVSTEDQANNGAGLEIQRAAITAECQRRGWELVDVIEDARISGEVPFAERPGGKAILERLTSKRAAGLIVTKMDRLSQSSLDAEQLVELFRQSRWELTLLDPVWRFEEGSLVGPPSPPPPKVTGQGSLTDPGLETDQPR